MVLTMKLQSPDYDAVNGFEIALPVTMDSYQGDSLAALIPLFDGDNKVLDFRQFSETITLAGVLTVQAASEAGFANPIQMRDELIRIRGARANFGKNTSGTAKSWINEGSGSFPFHSANWGTGTLPADEQDSSTSRKAATCRLIWDRYYNPSTGLYGNLFLYGAVSSISFASRPGATTLTRIPFSVKFLAASVKVGD